MREVLLGIAKTPVTPGTNLAVTGVTAPPEPLLTAAQAAEYLGVMPNTLNRLAREGTIPSMKVGRGVLFDRAAISKPRKA